jgi:hypothetical protein
MLLIHLDIFAILLLMLSVCFNDTLPFAGSPSLTNLTPSLLTLMTMRVNSEEDVVTRAS